MGKGVHVCYMFVGGSQHLGKNIKLHFRDTACFLILH